jgi:hypothetical protein
MSRSDCIGNAALPAGLEQCNGRRGEARRGERVNRAGCAATPPLRAADAQASDGEEEP